jgi:hypothetical protein
VENIKGFLALTDEQKELFKETHQAHLSMMGTATRKKHAVERIKEVKWDKEENCLKVFYDSGDWYHYTSQEWY